MRGSRLLKAALRCSAQRNRTCECQELNSVAAVPGSVTEYHHHILIKLHPSPSDAQAGLGSWWPSLVEREPAVLQVFRALAAHRLDIGDGVKTKVTAFDDISTAPRSPREDTCEVIIWPAGLRYTALPLAELDAVVAHGTAAGTLPPLPAAARACQAEVGNKLLLFVCCHGARDVRCGTLGPLLVAELLRQVRLRGLQDRIEVHKTSHVGGHKYAGNLLVYGAFHPADGDWFGSLRAEDAGELLDALANIEVGTDGGAGDARLRRWWRGRAGLNKQEQVELYEAGGGVVEETVEGVSDEEELSEEEEEEGVEAEALCERWRPGDL